MRWEKDLLPQSPKKAKEEKVEKGASVDKNNACVRTNVCVFVCAISYVQE